jgi:serine-type D-Ala-D-Ala endopeptidase (penicillin-binding protein 7)
VIPATRLFRAVSILVAACLLWPILVTDAIATPDPRHLRLASPQAVVFDAENGKVLYARNANHTVPIASITKLMTAMIVLDGRQPLGEQLTITDADIDRIKGTRSRLRVGTRQTRRELLRLALMASENRAASALSRHYPGGRKAFIAAMNRKAAALSMRHTRFADATGLTSLNRSSAADLVIMAQVASRYTIIREYTTTAQQTVQFPPPLYAQNFMNSNRLVRAGTWNIELSKTGFTREAGRCLVMKTRVADRSLVVVLLNSWGRLTPIGDANRIKHWLEDSSGAATPRIAARKVSPRA